MIAPLHALLDDRDLGVRVGRRCRKDVGKIAFAHVVRTAARDQEPPGVSIFSARRLISL